MIERFKQARALVQDAQVRLDLIKKAYQTSLDKKTVEISLQVGIKGILDNLRSALDYIAHELFQRYGSGVSDSKVYFPIAAKGAKKSDFQSLVGKKIPGLLDKRPDLVTDLEAFQELSSSRNAWLPDLATLSIENKHKNLSPQTRKETKQLRIQSGGVSVSMGEGTSISMGLGTSIKMGGMTIPGGQVIRPGSPVLSIGTGTVEHITWVSFDFDDISRPVLPFLEEAIKGVLNIVDALNAKCGEMG